MNFTPEFMLQIVVALGTTGGVYAAIRADLAVLHERTASNKEAITAAHERLDRFDTYCHKRNDD